MNICQVFLNHVIMHTLHVKGIYATAKMQTIYVIQTTVLSI